MAPSVYVVLANAVFVLHLLVIGYLLGGSAFVLTKYASDYPFIRSLHLLFVGITVISQIVFLGCPLVELEAYFRRKYNPDYSYHGSFTVYLIEKMSGVTVPVEIVTLATFAIAAIAVSAWLIWRG